MIDLAKWVLRVVTLGFASFHSGYLIEQPTSCPFGMKFS